MATISSFVFNANTGVVTLAFDVNVATLDTSKIFAVESNTSTTTQYPLAGVVTGLGTNSITITLSTQALYNIAVTWNQTTQVWQADTNCYIYVANSTATSPTFSGTPFHRQVSSYTARTTRPNFLGAEIYFDKTQSYNGFPYNVVCRFDFPMDTNAATVGTFGPFLTLTNGAGFTQGPGFSTPPENFFSNGPNIYWKFSDDDFITFRNTPNFLTTTSNSTVSISSVSIPPDLFGVPNTANVAANDASFSADLVTTKPPGSFNSNIANTYLQGGAGGNSLVSGGISGQTEWTYPPQPDKLYAILQLNQLVNGSITTVGRLGSSYDVSSWKVNTFPLTAADSTNIHLAVGNGIIIVNYYNDVAVSTTDGASWTISQISTGALTNWRIQAISVSNEVPVLFIATDPNAITTNKIRTSTDGITWTERTVPSSQTWNRAAASPTEILLISTGASGQTSTAAAKSVDGGATWTAITLPTMGTGTYTGWQDITYGNGKYIITGYNDSTGYISSSTNAGTSWTTGTSSTSTDLTNGGWFSVNWNPKNKVFVVSGKYLTDATTFLSYMLNSTDGVSWTKGNTNANTTLTNAYSWSNAFTHDVLMSNGNMLGLGQDITLTNSFVTITKDSGLTYEPVRDPVFFNIPPGYQAVAGIQQITSDKWKI